MKKIIIALFIVGITMSINAQQNDFGPSKTQFMVRGYGHTGINSLNINGDKESSYQGSAFAPIFLFKHSDKLMFEAELEFVLDGNALEIGLEYANIMYVLNKNVTVRAGKFLLPFGTFMERLHPSWINRLSTKPLGFGHGGIAPSTGVGLELRGAFEIGKSKLNYSFYTTNGPRLKDGSIEPEEAGMLLFQNYEDNNRNKAFGGRIGFLPFNDSSLELGASFYSAKNVGDQESSYENVGAFLYALDFSYVKQIPSLGGIIDIKGQYNNSKLDNATYSEIDNNGLVSFYTFTNQSDAFYAQLSYRPTMSDNDIFRKLEFVGRYSTFNTPEGSEWEEQSVQYVLGMNYWISWRSVLKFSYQTTDTAGGHGTVGITNIDGVFLHWAIGL